MRHTALRRCRLRRRYRRNPRRIVGGDRRTAVRATGPQIKRGGEVPPPTPPRPTPPPPPPLSGASAAAITLSASAFGCRVRRRRRLRRLRCRLRRRHRHRHFNRHIHRTRGSAHGVTRGQRGRPRKGVGGVGWRDGGCRGACGTGVGRGRCCMDEVRPLAEMKAVVVGVAYPKKCSAAVR